MSFDVTHYLLVGGASFAGCAERVIVFFKKNLLVKYDQVKIVEEGSCSAENADFWKLAEEKIDENHNAVAGFIKELQESGFTEIADLNAMGQGYESKVLHIITHMVDGFFGADTVLYNIEEDSHWISDTLVAEIREKPGEFWLIEAKCSSGAVSDRLGQIRRFEVRLER